MAQRYMVISGTLLGPDEKGERRTLSVGEIALLEPDAAEGHVIGGTLRHIPDPPTPKKKGAPDAEKDAAARASSLAVSAAEARRDLIEEWLDLDLATFCEQVGMLRDEALLVELANMAKLRELAPDYARACATRARNLLEPGAHMGPVELDPDVELEIVIRPGKPAPTQAQVASEPAESEPSPEDDVPRGGVADDEAETSIERG